MKFIFTLCLIMLVPNPFFAQNGKSVKRGIAYGYHSEADLASISEGLAWWYNWAVQPDSKVAGLYESYNMDFVPMTWNNNFNETSLRAFYTAHPDARYLLAFNEPNFIKQANMKPSQVAAAWHRLEAIAADFNLEIVGPAVNWCGECVSEGGVTFTNPYAYLDTFFSICPDCKVDYIAVHNYMCYSGALSGYVDGFKKYGKKIWLTEYACWDQNNITLSMQKNLMKGSIDYMEKDTMIFRYSWFTGNRSGAYPYLDIYAPTAGELTELGQFYVDYRAFIPDTSYYTPVPDRIEAEHFTAMSGVQTEAVTDFDGFDDVGYIDGGDWMEFNVDVPGTAEYYIYFRVASTASTSIILIVDGQNTDTLKVPSSGGWQNWRTLEIQSGLPAGKHKLRLTTPTGNFNLNWIRISDHENNLPTPDAGADQIITWPENTASMAGSGSDIDGDKLLYKWTKVSGPTSFAISNPASPTPDITGLVKGRYIFNLEVSDGTEIASDRVTVDVIFATGVEETGRGSCKIYPNPVHDVLFIENKEFAGKTELNISDPVGRKMKSVHVPYGISNLEIDVSSFNPGLYLLRISNESGTSVHSIIKN